jgi:hypothetical protein
MRPLRYLYVLALVVWVGGLAVAGLVVAPIVFGTLEAWNPSEGRVLAGEVFGAVLARVHVVAYAAGGVMIVALVAQRLVGPRPPSFGIRVALLALMLAIMVYSGAVLAPRIDRVQASVSGPINALPEGDARRVEFDRLHGLSTTLVTAALAGGLVLLGWEARE